MTKDTDKKELFIGSAVTVPHSWAGTALLSWLVGCGAYGMNRVIWCVSGKWQRVNEGQGRCNDQVKEGQGCHESNEGKGCKNWFTISSKEGRDIGACMHACMRLVLPNSAWDLILLG